MMCLFELPYSFYELIRFIAFVVFGYLAYDAVRGSKDEIAFALTVCFIIVSFFKNKRPTQLCKSLIFIVGVTRFELATTRPPASNFSTNIFW